MDQKEKRKKEILDERLPSLSQRMTKANREILDVMSKALKDRKIDAKLHMGILSKLKAVGQIGFDSSIKMDGPQRLEMIKMFFENAQATRDAAFSLEIRGYESELKRIDKDIQTLQEELKQIEHELKSTEEKGKRSELKEEREKKMTLAE